MLLLSFPPWASWHFRCTKSQKLHLNKICVFPPLTSVDVCDYFSSVWVSGPILYLQLSLPRCIAKQSQSVLLSGETADCWLQATGNSPKQSPNKRVYVLLTFGNVRAKHLIGIKVGVNHSTYWIWDHRLSLHGLQETTPGNGDREVSRLKRQQFR